MVKRLKATEWAVVMLDAPRLRRARGRRGAENRCQRQEAPAREETSENTTLCTEPLSFLVERRPEELARVLGRVVRRKRKLLQSRRLMDEPVEEHALSQLQAQALQASSPGLGLLLPHPARRLAAEQDGYSLEAGTHLHAHDRLGLEQRCRYRLRAPFSQHRLARLADGRIQLELRRRWRQTGPERWRSRRGSCCFGSPRSCRRRGRT